MISRNVEKAMINRIGKDNVIIKVIDKVPAKSLSLKTVQASELSDEVFWQEYVCTHTPVIIKGATAEWLALSKWGKKGYLESICTEEFSMTSKTFNPLPPEPYYKTGEAKALLHFINDIRISSHDATYSMPAIPVPKKWQQDLGSYSFLTEKFEKPPIGYPEKRLFVYKNASTEWHYHTFDETITSQLVGSKRISLFRLTNDNWENFAPVIEANFHHMPCADQFFPAESSLVKLEGMLEPGDSIYIPPFWWHGVDPADSEFGVTLAHCFRSPLRRVGSFKDPVTRQSLQEAPLLKKTGLYMLVAMSSLSRKFANERWWPV